VRQPVSTLFQTYVKDTDGRFVEVIWGGDPLELVPEFLDRVRETLYVSSAVIKEVETHKRGGWSRVSRELRLFESVSGIVLEAGNVRHYILLSTGLG